MLRNRKISRLLSMIVVFVLLLASIPAKEVKAAENGQDIFVITSFEKMDKEDEWKLEKTTFVPGTEIKDMKFPEEWNVKGYWKSDAAKTEIEKKLEKLEWKGFLWVKEGETGKKTEEVYAKESPEGKYLFEMQLPERTVTEEEVEVPSQKIVIEKEKKEEPPTAEPSTPPAPTTEPTPPTTKLPAGGAPKELTTAPAIITPTPTEEPAKSTEAKIISFKIGDCEGKIDEDQKSIEVVVPYGTNVKTLKPEIMFSDKAICRPASEEEQDFTDPVVYEVTAEDTTTVCKYEVTVIVAECTHDWQDATCTDPKTCKICGKKEGEAIGHDWKPAGCTDPETCSTCQETRGEAKGHQWIDATCTDPKTCTVCGTKEGEALGHDWKPAICTDPDTCIRCALTRGEPLGHSWGEWKVTKQPTVKSGGEEERICTRCQQKEVRETPRLNIIGKAKNNYVSGIREKGVYGIDELLTITACGDGMGIEAPIANDVRYVPAGWKITTYNIWGKPPYKSSFRVKEEGDYQLQVHFQKQIHDGKNWVSQKETDIKYVNFTISASKIVPVKTDDESPVEFLVILMALSVLVLLANAGWNVKKISKVLQSLAKNV